VPDRTIVCRCEDLTLQDIRDVLTRGVTTIEEIKRLTRCGMGPCQGRNCRQVVAAEIARATGLRVDEVAMPVFRPPTKPVKLELILRGDGSSDGAAARGSDGHVPSDAHA
jgi:bacterioferritin-associated ferredoxin